MSRTTVDDHIAHVRGLLDGAFGGVETVPLREAIGRVTARAVLSPVDLPLFRNSQMDGFAVNTADLSPDVTLPIVGEIPAKPMSPVPLERGTTVRIMTGAVVPEGADAIIPVEDTTVTDAMVTIHRGRRSGEYVRDRGSDVLEGDELLPARQRLASRHLAVLAAAGVGTIEVLARPRVAVVTSGAELIGPDETPAMGQVFDANGIAVIAAVEAAGGTVTIAVRVTDDVDLMLAALEAAAHVSDVIVTSGGISMGDYEVVREALEPRGARIGHIAMQPGGPQATAVVDGTPVLCFPGNPVSTQISFEVFLAPLLREAAGLAPAGRVVQRLTHLVDSIPGKRQFLRGRSLAGGRVEIVSGPGSHLVAGLAASDVLVDVPEDVTELQEGDALECWIL